LRVVWMVMMRRRKVVLSMVRGLVWVFRRRIRGVRIVRVRVFRVGCWLI